jgi:glyoxylase-like metal-dependent hydrolase (beta-lactamase superfamily II)
VAEDLVGHDVAMIRADNPGPFTLSGTNTWVVGRDPAFVVDPGPALAGHVAAVVDEVERRGGVGGIALTHDHDDHAGALRELRRRTGDPPVAAAAGGAAGAARLADGQAFGPFTAYATPGHAPDHLAFVAGDACFTGDAVLGQGSVFIAPDTGAMSAYLRGLRRLRSLPLALLCPGHGPLVPDPAAKLDEYITHRLDRECRLLDALARGLRSEADLLDAVWDDAPAVLRPATTATLRAHLDKLREDGRLPRGAGESAGGRTRTA